MNKNLLVALIAGGILLFGGVAYFVLGNSDSDNPLVTVETIDGVPVLSGEAVSYPTTMTGTVTDTASPSDSGTIMVAMQDANTWSMMLTSEEGTSEIIYAADASYLQNPDDGTWLKLPATDAADSPLGSVALSPEDFNEYQQNANYVGKQSCNQGMCDTWEWTDPLGTGDTALLKIGSEGRIAEVTGTSGTSTVELVYDYETPVNVEIPADAIEFDIPQ